MSEKLAGPQMDDVEVLLKFSRRSFIVLFAIFVVAGGAIVWAAVAVNAAPSAWPQRVWIVPVLLIVMAGMMLRQSSGGKNWKPDSPGVKLIVDDEFRRMNMERARRVAFAVVLAAQVPLGFALMDLPAFRALLAMASATITLGMATLIGCFLVFNRDR